MAPLGGSQLTCGPSATTFDPCTKHYTFTTASTAGSLTPVIITSQLFNWAPTTATDVTTPQTGTTQCLSTATLPATPCLTSSTITTDPTKICNQIWYLEYPRVACVEWKVNFARLLTTTDGTNSINDINIVTDYSDTVTPKTYTFSVFAGPGLETPDFFNSQAVNFMYFYEEGIVSGAVSTLSTALCMALVTTVLF